MHAMASEGAVHVATKAVPSVIIPAHNEEATIGRCLAALLAHSAPDEFEIIVVCNGCTDRTGEVARSFGTSVRVIEIETGSKVLALNIGNSVARGYPRLYLDADLEISTSSARKLISAARGEGALAAIGRMELDFSGTGFLLRQYYRVWSSNGYLAAGKFGGAYSLSEEGCRLVGTLPPVVNDDEYVRRLIPAQGVRFEPDCCFVAKVPRTFRDLLRVRRRVHGGNKQLDLLSELPRRNGSHPGPANSLLRLVRMPARKPSLWAGVIVYVVVNTVARIGAGAGQQAWGRDESTRTLARARHI